jgi:4,5-DOPA dioxygenase extradiol
MQKTNQDTGIPGMAVPARMPVLFLGHGSPMNAIAENEFVEGFRRISGEIRKPDAILCISAHWETNGTFITAMEMPRTIHDFGGFPRELFEVQYPAPGNPELARDIAGMITGTKVGLDENWGLDHGAWSVIKHLFPDADVPVLQLSLDRAKSTKAHYDLAKELSGWREKGILIIGSGNIVHNLGLVDWYRLNDIGYGFEWALEAREKLNAFILSGDLPSLINYKDQGRAVNTAIPTPEHFLPLLYALAVTQGNEKITLFNDKPVAGSLTMTSVKATQAYISASFNL